MLFGPYIPVSEQRCSAELILSLGEGSIYRVHGLIQVACWEREGDAGNDVRGTSISTMALPVGRLY
jgi:hypothetical protein